MKSKTSKDNKISVSESALIRRMNRKLIGEDQVLRKSRSSRSLHETGEFFIINTMHGGMDESHVDIEALGREIGALKAYEKLAE